MDLLSRFRQGQLFADLTTHLGLASGPQRVWVEGLSGSAKALLVAAVHALAAPAPAEGTPSPSLSFPVVLAVAEVLEDAYRLRQDLANFLPEGTVHLFPGPEIIEGRVLPLGWQELIHRMRALVALAFSRPCVVIATPRGLASLTLAPGCLRGVLRTIEVGSGVELAEMTRHLVSLGYRRVANTQSRGEFSIRGGILDVYPPHEAMPHRLELAGDAVDEIRTFDPATQRSREAVHRVVIGPVREILTREGVAGRLMASLLPEHLRPLVMDAFLEGAPKGAEALLGFLDDQRGTLADHLPDRALAVLDLSPRAFAKARQEMAACGLEGALEAGLAALTRWPLVALATPPLDLTPITALASHAVPSVQFHGDLARFVEAVRAHLARGYRVVFALSTAGNVSRAREIFADHRIPATTGTYDGEGPVVSIVRADLEAGFVLDDARLAVLAENDLWRDRGVRRDEVAPAAPGVSFSDFTEIEVGSLVVHSDHGIGRFEGLTSLIIDGVKQEFLAIAFARGDKLFVPVSQLDRVQRFVGVEEGKAPSLSQLGSTRWATAKARAAVRVKDLAERLLKLYARREVARATPMGPDTVWQRELEESFAFEETPDQTAAMEVVKADLGRQRPMDRLVCGDVGYGKTELAIRGAFKAVQEGKQAAVLVPTTVLAQQHLHTFRTRLGAFPITIEVLSRLRTRAQQEETIARLASGKVDIVVGTHRLLSRDVTFADLGFLVVDEEQRFGVAHKERIKELRDGVHVLLLTATPIPRTLNLALGGLRDVSLINTPPRGRIPIRTFVMEFEEALVKGAIERELRRGGQVFYVYNRIGDMDQMKGWLLRLVPAARIRPGHGQMPREDLERLMEDFYGGRFDVLLSTTIIESGLDIPNVNTIIVHDATRFGLSQLYQLRGRVGRSDRQAYAYFLFPGRTVLTELSFQRLKALEEHTELGAGFKIAMRDLELRGAGNLLGAEQSGFLHTVGFEMFTRLLKVAVADLSGREDLRPVDFATVELQADCFIPESYIEDHDTRILFYRRLSEAESDARIAEIQRDLADRFGSLPDGLDGLFRLIRIRIWATRLGVASIKQKAGRVHVTFAPRRDPPRVLVDHLLARHARRIHFERSSTAAFWVELGLRSNEEVLSLLENMLEVPGPAGGVDLQKTSPDAGAMAS